MKARPILFRSDNVHYLVTGSKTQTRRPLKGGIGPDAEAEGGIIPARAPMRYGEPGDYLWVREQWNAINPAGKWWSDYNFLTRPSGDQWEAHYKNVGSAFHSEWGPSFSATRRYSQLARAMVDVPRWVPGMFMPMWASRAAVRIVEIRVERLQDITEWDAASEGALLIAGPNFAAGAVEAYKMIWDSINGKRAPWASNPWVIVISFLPVSVQWLREELRNG